MPRRSDGGELGAVIRLLRAYRGWGQGKLAAAAGFSRAQVCDWERGRKVPEVESLVRITAALGLPLLAVDSALALLEALHDGARREAGRREAAAAGAAGTAPAGPVGAGRGGLPQGPPSLAGGWLERGGAEPEPRCRPEFPAGDEGRRRAAEVCARLEPYTATVRRAVVEGVEEFEDLRGRDACERLCAESERLAEGSAEAAVEVAELAVQVARLAPGEPAWRSSLEAYAVGFLAAALRAAGDLAGAEKALARSAALRQAGTASGFDLAEDLRVLDIEASICRDRGRLAEALELHRRALELAPPGQATARLLVNQSETHAALGEHAPALAALEKAAQHFDRPRDPRLWWLLQQNLALNLCRLGRRDQARALLAGLQRGAQWLPSEIDRLRLRQLEELVAAEAGAEG
ncbi:MAG TPA: helix-turn-helix transcriptional regulator [Thermoanaerobaculia bacterium]|nr:helix-turn-helix transcriptional regulator [Thermoanaerobaculia bacterium]